MAKCIKHVKYEKTKKQKIRRVKKEMEIKRGKQKEKLH